MRCVEARELLSEYVDNELDQVRAKELEEHLHECMTCSSELQLLRAQIRCCAELSNVELPEGFHEELMARVRASLAQHSSAGETKKMSFLSRWIAKGVPARYRAVAGIALVLLLAFALSQVSPLVNMKMGSQPAETAGQPAVTKEEARGLQAPQAAPDGKMSYSSVMTMDRAPAEGLKAGSALLAAVPEQTGVTRKLIKRGNLGLEVPEGSLDKAAQNVQAIVQSAGGYIENSSSSSDGDKRGTIYFTLRIPEDQFDSIFEQLSKIGRVVSRSISASDVTEQFIDVQAQLRNKERQEQRLIEIMGKANTVGEILQVENELDRVRTEIDSLKQRLKYLENATSMSTIGLTISEPKGLMPAGGSVLESAWQAFLRAARSVLITFASLVPYALAICLIWWVVATLLKRTRKTS